MKNPPGYGSIVKLNGKRRKPYAVRITTGRHKNTRGQWIYTYKYLEYFDKLKDANTYLANYNLGNPIKQHTSLIKEPTFKELYEEFIRFKSSLNKPPSNNTFVAWKTAYSHCKSIWDMKYKNIRTSDFQTVADGLKSKSYSSVSGVTKFLNNLYDFAAKNDYAEKNYSQYATWEYEDREKDAHIPFSEKEIEQIRHANDPTAKIALILIYSGFRIMELLSVKTENVNLEEKYIIGGSKTEAGKNRTVPIHSSILPLIKELYNPHNTYLIEGIAGKQFTYRGFLYRWSCTMEELGMSHTPHDCRHTFATLADRYGVNDICTKLIMGHSIKDITKGVYTHKSPAELAVEIEKIPTSFAT